jgi:hypothetical protein
VSYTIKLYSGGGVRKADAASLEEARAFVESELTEGERSSPDRATIVHPDGTEECWRQEIRYSAVRCFEEES